MSSALLIVISLICASDIHTSVTLQFYTSTPHPRRRIIPVLAYPLRTTPVPSVQLISREDVPLQLDQLPGPHRHHPCSVQIFAITPAVASFYCSTSSRVVISGDADPLLLCQMGHSHCLPTYPPSPSLPSLLVSCHCVRRFSVVNIPRVSHFIPNPSFRNITQPPILPYFSPTTAL